MPDNVPVTPDLTNPPTPPTDDSKSKEINVEAIKAQYEERYKAQEDKLTELVGIIKDMQTKSSEVPEPPMEPLPENYDNFTPKQLAELVTKQVMDVVKKELSPKIAKIETDTLSNLQQRKLLELRTNPQTSTFMEKYGKTVEDLLSKGITIEPNLLLYMAAGADHIQNYKQTQEEISKWKADAEKAKMILPQRPSSSTPSSGSTPKTLRDEASSIVYDLINQQQ